MRSIILKLLIILTASYGVVMSPSQAKEPKNFQEAKRLARQVWRANRQTFYCGCRYDSHGRIDFNSCAFQPSDMRKNRRIEWEHVVPVSWYGRTLSCWQDKQCVSRQGKPLKGRACCRQVDPQFRAMEADLHNLVPCERDVNRARSHYRFHELPSSDRRFEQGFQGCSIVINEQEGWIAPNEAQKGMIARIYLYMVDKYHIPIAKSQRIMVQAWDKQYPASAWEHQWRKQVDAKMKNKGATPE